MVNPAKAQRKRKIAQAYLDIMLAIGHLQYLEEAAHDTHPDIAELLQTICVGLSYASDGVKHACLMIFGRVPEDFASWRNSGKRKRRVNHAPIDD